MGVEKSFYEKIIPLFQKKKKTARGGRGKLGGREKGVKGVWTLQRGVAGGAEGWKKKKKKREQTGKQKVLLGLKTGEGGGNGLIFEKCWETGKRLSKSKGTEKGEKKGGGIP